jgi:hypothetical protein
MLKSIIRSACLLALATLSLAEMTPALATDNTCAADCTRTRPCEYKARELTLTPPAGLVPTEEPPAPLVDPPPVETPVSPPQPLPEPPAPRPGRNRRGRG